LGRFDWRIVVGLRSAKARTLSDDMFGIFCHENVEGLVPSIKSGGRQASKSLEGLVPSEKSEAIFFSFQSKTTRFGDLSPV
jgi:hypothetical protein